MTKPRKPLTAIKWQPLDLDARIGTYKVDAYAGQITRAANAEEGRRTLDAREVREFVMGIAEAAIEFAEGAHNDVTHYSDARHHLVDLLALEERARIIGRRDTAPFGAAFERVGYENEEPPAGELTEIAQLAAQLAEKITRLRADYSVGKALNPRNSKPLRNQFVGFAANAWRIRTGKWPPHSRAGLFVGLVVAAWADLGLPDLGDPVGVLGLLAETHSRE